MFHPTLSYMCINRHPHRRPPPDAPHRTGWDISVNWVVVVVCTILSKLGMIWKRLLACAAMVRTLLLSLRTDSLVKGGTAKVAESV